MADESSCVGHEPCPQCGSRDNLARYSDGHGFCFGCQFYQHPSRNEGTNHRRVARVSEDMLTGDVRALPKRALSEETCRHWRYQVGQKPDGTPVHIANYCDDQGVVVAQKIRTADKKFVWLGEPKKAGLYGQWLWRDGGKKVVVTEGEIDALSVSQLQSNKWPVVSVPSGAAGAPKAVANAIEWLERFEQVIFLFDDDEPGRESAKECAALLTPGKAHIGRIAGFKDSNEAVQAGEGARVIDAIWGAKAYRPDGVVMIQDLFATAFEESKRGVPWPWPTLDDATYGIRPEIYTLGGGVGCGKSEVLKEIALHLMNLGHGVGWIALEEPPNHSTKVITGKYLGKRLHIPGVVATKEELLKAQEYLCGRMALFEHFGAMDYETIKQKIVYMVTALGMRFIFLDHLTALAAAVEGDERRALDKLMADLSALVQRLNFTLFLVSHLATPEGKPHEEGGRVMAKHFRGSRAIMQWSHNMLGIERDITRPELATLLRMLKDRFAGDANGLCTGLTYDKNTGRFSECDPPDFDASAEKVGFKNEFAVAHQDF